MFNDLIYRLKKYREDNRLTQFEMAKRLGIGRAMYNLIENGREKLSKSAETLFIGLEQSKKINTANVNQDGNHNSNSGGNTINNSYNKDGSEGPAHIDNIIFDLQRELIEAQKHVTQTVEFNLKMVIDSKQEIIDIQKKVTEGVQEVVTTQRIVMQKDNIIQEKDNKIIELLEDKLNPSKP